ncbi:bucentaur or craniofacial development-domain-containing protein [Lipomyces oligophaga]|uniref:bucentaur or craniofacial development-domain-containing protein n=1 Tax=Lipomyces oligophaga TaxID=45792 RepID=UPI0034CECC8E
MAKLSENENKGLEEEYNESEDEDFNPNEPVSDREDLSSGPDDDEDLGNISDTEVATLKKKNKQSEKDPRKEDDGEKDGIKILTRSQRAAEKRFTQSKQTSTIDADAVWKSMQNESQSKEETRDEMITIVESVEFAKQVTVHERQVARSSAEGQAYLKRKQEAAAASNVTNTTKATRLRIKKRKKGSLEEMAGTVKPKKLNTLEKSKLDWQGFVSEEGIQDDLKQHNKGGYLHKQDFLARVDEKRYSDLKQGQRASKK